MAQLYDITWPIAADLAVWPGDVAFAWQWLALQEHGDAVNLGGLTMSPHMGTHADAPFHVNRSAATIDRVPLDVYLGPARLIDVRGRSPIRIEDLSGHDWAATPRLLLRTGAWQDPRHFPSSIPVLSSDVPPFLQALGIRLVGVDAPSIDELTSASLPLHHALGERGIHILEGLDLRLPPPGVYELIALPLRLQGGDGAPMRAVLRGGS
jgi:arylformamidase